MPDSIRSLGIDIGAIVCANFLDRQWLFRFWIGEDLVIYGPPEVWHPERSGGPHFGRPTWTDAVELGGT
jgi:hypothetical protein